MTLSIRRTLIAGAAVVPMLALLAGAAAQQQQVERQQPRDPQARQVHPGMDHVQDQHLIKFLKADTENTIALAKLAQQQSQTREVQEFAEKLIEDHQQFLNKLQQISPEGQRQPGQQRQPQQREQINNNNQQQREQPGRAQQRDIGSLIEQVGQQRRQLAERELREMEGRLFDLSYVGTEVVNHLQTVASLQVFRNYAQSQDLQQLIQEGTQTQQQHYQQAKRLYQQMAGNAQQGRQRDN
jgi:predicted outer membrane protein